MRQKTKKGSSGVKPARQEIRRWTRPADVAGLTRLRPPCRPIVAKASAASQSREQFLE